MYVLKLKGFQPNNAIIYGDVYDGSLKVQLHNNSTNQSKLAVGITRFNPSIALSEEAIHFLSLFIIIIIPSTANVLCCLQLSISSSFTAMFVYCDVKNQKPKLNK